MERKTLSVAGMSCNGCEQNVESALSGVEGVSQVEADHETDSVEVVVEEGVADDDISAAVSDAGYEVAG